MSRMPLQHRRGPFVWLTETISRRMMGQVPEPGLALMHNRRVLMTIMSNESKVARWRTLDDTTKALAVLASAAEIGCSWCLDYGYWASFHSGVDPAKLEAITQWDTAGVYTDDERAVIAYSIAMTRTPLEVTDDMVADLRARFTDAQLVELTAMVALENQRSRINAAFGLSSQGFRDSCELPALRQAQGT